MAERIKQRSPISAEDLIRTANIVNQALIDILLAKQIITEDELVNCIRKIGHAQMEMLSKPTQIFS